MTRVACGFKLPTAGLSSYQQKPRRPAFLVRSEFRGSRSHRTGAPSAGRRCSPSAARRIGADCDRHLYRRTLRGAALVHEQAPSGDGGRDHRRPRAASGNTGEDQEWRSCRRYRDARAECGRCHSEFADRQARAELDARAVGTAAGQSLSFDICAGADGERIGPVARDNPNARRRVLQSGASESPRRWRAAIAASALPVWANAKGWPVEGRGVSGTAPVSGIDGGGG